MNILIIVNNLSGGGAEKVAVDLGNHLSTKHNVSFLTLSNKPDKYVINDNINRKAICLNAPSGNVIKGLFSNINRILLLRKEIIALKPDLVISFMNRTNIRVLISLINTKIPVVITEHNYPKMNKMSLSWEFLRRIMYKKAFKLVSVSKGIQECFNYLKPEKKMVIYNPTDIRLTNEKCDIKIEGKNFFTMGRLVNIKGFDILIKAFSKISDRYPDWKLNILGEGPEEHNLRMLVKEHNLEERILFHGFVKNPHYILKDCDVCVVPSRSEGFSLVIIEAMKCGVPVVSTDCPVGPRELIENMINGVLVKNEDVDELAKGMELLISDNDLIKKLKNNASDMLDRFENETIFSEWDSLIESINNRE